MLVAVPVLALTACSNSNSDDSSSQQGRLYGNMTVQDLQQRYNTVYFGFDKYDISAEYAQLLDAHAAYLNETPANVVVEGNTDERGTPEYNIALGQRRADAVKNYLLARGVQGTKVSTISYGEEKPAMLGHSEAEYAKNRRAVLAY